jgi:PAS domain-containing protein
VLLSFRYSLNEGGLLFLGPVESMAQSGELFQILDPKHRIYVRSSTHPYPTPGVMRSKEAVHSDICCASAAGNADWRKRADPFIEDRYAVGLQAPETSDGESSPLKRQNAELIDRLQSLREDHEAALEEQKASNEESREELRSTNEELSTAKEEVQSANEELITVNQELQLRNRELGGLAGDLNNLLAAVDLPILMLDRNLLLRRFTPAAALPFGISPADLGRAASERSRCGDTLLPYTNWRAQ